jgi:hypothetical protein
LNDDDEIIYGTDINNEDSDSDNLNDGEEVLTYFTNPLDSDTDVDGMSDGYEVSFNLDPLVNDSEEDKDNDGITNINEMLANTDPNNPDTDGDGISDEADSNPLVANSAPEISGSPNTMVQENEPYSFEPSLVYAGVLDSITLTIINMPTWADFNDKTGALTGTPENADVGEYNGIVIKASNNAYTSQLEEFSIVVNNVNDAPVMSAAIPSQSFNVDSAINIDVSTYFTDIDKNDKLTFSLENLPSGLAISAEGIITGSVSSAGTYSIKIIVTDTDDLMVQGSLNLAISEVDSKSSSSGGAIYGFLVLLLLGLKRFR